MRNHRDCFVHPEDCFYDTVGSLALQSIEASPVKLYYLRGHIKSFPVHFDLLITEYTSLCIPYTQFILPYRQYKTAT